jgi:hypothetical protein
MKTRTWRALALAASVAVVVLLATQRAAGQPSDTVAGDPDQTGQSISTAIDRLAPFEIPESGSLVLLGSAFVVVAQQLRRMM